MPIEPRGESSERLKVIMAEIRAILLREDIAGLVMLHDPAGYGEHLMHLMPSYSCLQMGDGMARLRSKLADYGGDRAAQRLHQESTANMCAVLADAVSYVGVMMIKIATIANEALGAEHSGETFTPHRPQ